jgi:hypothetical protein
MFDPMVRGDYGKGSIESVTADRWAAIRDFANAVDQERWQPVFYDTSVRFRLKDERIRVDIKITLRGAVERDVWIHDSCHSEVFNSKQIGKTLEKASEYMAVYA